MKGKNSQKNAAKPAQNAAPAADGKTKKELSRESREAAIRKYFECWVLRDGTEMDNILAQDAECVECDGSEYHGRDQIERNFAQWIKDAIARRWNALSFFHDSDETAVRWYFESLKNGALDCMDGVSLVRFNENGKIISMQEYRMEHERQSPYDE